MKTLVLGGARSGKSRYAEQVALACNCPVTYIATATVGDEEMAARIQRHQADRLADWTTVEAPLALAQALQDHAAAGHCVLVDCLTLWLSNCLAQESLATEATLAPVQEFFEVLPQLPGEIIFVSNETGLGVVPMGQLSRRFVDEAGRLHQALARQCEQVVMTVAGLPMVLKAPLKESKI